MAKAKVGDIVEIVNPVDDVWYKVGDEFEVETDADKLGNVWVWIDKNHHKAMILLSIEYKVVEREPVEKAVEPEPPKPKRIVFNSPNWDYLDWSTISIRIVKDGDTRVVLGIVHETDEVILLDVDEIDF